MRHPGVFVALLVTMSAALNRQAEAQQLYFPPIGGATWETVFPSSLDWNSSYIDSLRDYLATQNTRTFMFCGNVILRIWVSHNV